MSSEQLITALAATSLEELSASERADAIRECLYNAQYGLPAIKTKEALDELVAALEKAKQGSLEILSKDEFISEKVINAAVSDHRNIILIIRKLTEIAKSNQSLEEKQKDAEKYLVSEDCPLHRMQTEQGARNLLAAIKAQKDSTLKYLYADIGLGILDPTHHDKAPFWLKLERLFGSHIVRTARGEVKAIEAEDERLEQKEIQQAVAQASASPVARQDTPKPQTPPRTPSSSRSPSPVRSSSPTRRVAEIGLPEQKQARADEIAKATAEARRLAEKQAAIVAERKELEEKTAAVRAEFAQLKLGIPEKLRQLEAAQAKCEKALQTLAEERQQFAAIVSARERLHTAEKTYVAKLNGVNQQIMEFGCKKPEEVHANPFERPSLPPTVVERQAALESLQGEIKREVAILERLKKEDGEKLLLAEYQSNNAMLNRNANRFNERIDECAIMQEGNQQQAAFEQDKSSVEARFVAYVESRKKLVDEKSKQKISLIGETTKNGLQAIYASVISGAKAHVYQTNRFLLEQCVDNGPINDDRDLVASAVNEKFNEDAVAKAEYFSKLAGHVKVTEEEYRRGFEEKAKELTTERGYEFHSSYANRVTAIVIMAQLKRLETILESKDVVAEKKADKFLEWYDAFAKTVTQSKLSSTQKEALLAPYKLLQEQFLKLEAAEMEKFASQSRGLTQERGKIIEAVDKLTNELEVTLQAVTVNPSQPPVNSIQMGMLSQLSSRPSMGS